MEIMKDVKDGNKEQLRECIEKWEELTMRKTDKMEILLMLRSVVAG